MVKEIYDEDSEDGIKIHRTNKEEKEWDDALDYLGLDNKEVEDAAFVNFKINKEVSKRVTKLTQLPMSFRMSLEGKSYDEEKGGYRQTSKAIAGQRFISKSNGILTSFASESNLLTQKNMETFIIQFADACRKIEKELLRDRSISEKNTRVIFKMFKDTLFNVGEIITGSKENMQAIFGQIDKERQENREPIGF